MRLFYLSGTIIQTLFMVVLSVSTAVGQTPFVKFYPQGEASFVNDAVLISPERLILAGEEFFSGTRFSEPRVLTLAADGEVVSNERLPSEVTQSVRSVVRLSDDRFYLGISASHRDSLENWKSYRMSTTSSQLDGNIWSYNATSVIIESSVALPGGDVVSVGSIRPNVFVVQAFIAREGPGGIPVFQQLLDLPPERQAFFRDIKLMEDGSLLVIGTVVRGGRGIIVINFDPDGSLKWSKKYLFSDGPTNATTKLALLENNAFAFSIVVNESSNANNAGFRTLIVRCDAAGEVQQANIYGSTIALTGFDLLPKPGGNLFFAGSISLPDNIGVSGIVAEISLSGEITEQRIWKGPGSMLFRQIIPWHNGQGYYLIGHGAVCPQENLQMMIVSVDANLNPPENSCLEASDFEIIVAEVQVTIADEAFGMETVTLSTRPAPDFIQTPAFASELECLNLTLNDNVTTDTFCYREEFALDRPVSLMDDQGITLDSVGISLSGPDQRDYLFLPENPAYILSGQNSDMLTILPATPLGARELPMVIRGLRFGNVDDAPATGLRTVTISIFYGCERVETVSFSVFVYGLANSVPGFPSDSVLCPGDTLLLNAAIPGATAYRWNTGSTDAVLSVTASGTYAVAITDYCQVDTFNIEVTEASVSDLADREELLFSCLGDSVQFRPLVSPDIALSWADGFPVADRFFTESGTYQLIQSTVCAEAVITVKTVVQSCCEVYLPNAFSPNGDGVNDRFIAFPGIDDCRLATNFRLKVYDRWGGLAFSGDGKEEGWDGTSAGKPAKAGTYVFTLSYFNGETEIRLGGSVALLR